MNNNNNYNLTHFIPFIRFITKYNARLTQVRSKNEERIYLCGVFTDRIALRK